MDPIIELILQMALGGDGTVPEVNSRGQQQPIDIGTIAQNINLQQDATQMLLDPMRGAMMGYFDPAQFQPREVWPEAPEAPSTPLLNMYGESDNEVMQLIIQGLSEGRTPQQVVKDLQEDGLIGQAALNELDGRVDNSEAEGWLNEARSLQQELASLREYQSKTVNQSPTYEPTDTMKKFDSFNLPYPTERYSEEDFVPQLQGLRGREESTAGSADRIRQDAYANALRDFHANTGPLAPEVEQEATPASGWSPTSGRQFISVNGPAAGYSAAGAREREGRAASTTSPGGQNFVSAFLGLQPQVRDEKSRREVDAATRRTLHGDQSYRAAQRAATAARLERSSAEREARKAAREAERRGITPFSDFLMGRAGL